MPYSLRCCLRRHCACRQQPEPLPPFFLSVFQVCTSLCGNLRSCLVKLRRPNASAVCLNLVNLTREKKLLQPWAGSAFWKHGLLPLLIQLAVITIDECGSFVPS